MSEVGVVVALNPGRLTFGREKNVCPGLRVKSNTVVRVARKSANANALGNATGLPYVIFKVQSRLIITWRISTET